MTIFLNQTEKEMCGCAGFHPFIFETESPDSFAITVTAPQARELVGRLETLIEAQESDSGCWTTAQIWRDHKAPLIHKFRRLMINILKEES